MSIERGARYPWTALYRHTPSFHGKWSCLWEWEASGSEIIPGHLFFFLAGASSQPCLLLAGVTCSPLCTRVSGASTQFCVGLGESLFPQLTKEEVSLSHLTMEGSLMYHNPAALFQNSNSFSDLPVDGKCKS